MADTEDVKKEKEAAALAAGGKDKNQTVEVPLAVLTQMQEQMAQLEAKDAEREAKMAGMEAMIESNQGANTIGEQKIREKKSFEPKFRQLTLRKYPIAGDQDNMGIVAGWTSRGAYQEVDTSGVNRAVVDYIDIIFLGQEKTKEGKIKAEKVKLLDLLNKGTREWYKILDTKTEPRQVPTNEEINVTVWDPAHGLVETGDTIDGYVMFTDRKYLVSIPGQGEVWIDGEFANK